jgi:hypothetical protein
MSRFVQRWSPNVNEKFSNFSRGVKSRRKIKNILVKDFWNFRRARSLAFPRVPDDGFLKNVLPLQGDQRGCGAVEG